MTLLHHNFPRYVNADFHSLPVNHQSLHHSSIWPGWLNTDKVGLIELSPPSSFWPTLDLLDWTCGSK